MKLVLYRKGKQEGEWYPAWKFEVDEKTERLEIDGQPIEEKKQHQG